MTWSYSGDPGKSDLDRYRFIIGDTLVSEPVLQDEEINFILAENTGENTRLYQLFDRAATFFARKVNKSLGPMSEDSTNRLNFFQDKAKYYKSLLSTGSGLSYTATDPIFYKGMFDNV